MNLEEFAHYLGRLHSNLLTLEFALRAYLYARADPPHNPLPDGIVLTSLKAGDTVPVNALTDFSALGQLIERYNNLVKPTHPELAVDSTIVELRDALAHGRIATIDPNKDMVLLKFAKPSHGCTSATYSQDLSSQWIDEQVDRVLDEIKKISKAPGSPLDNIFQ